MKVILSRKGFDSSNGGYASPILPDGTMLSMPIPSDNDDILFSDIKNNGVVYSDLLEQLTGGSFIDRKCHLDPDIRPNLRIEPVENWSPAFGQIHSAQGLLHNAGVEVGDVFLFFGWFRKTKETNDGYKYMSKKDSKDFYDISDLHAIYGYMQIGEIIKEKSEIENYSWHPHSRLDYNKSKSNNTLYIPAERLSFAPDKPGYGTFDFDKKFILTAENKTRSNWTYQPFLTEDNVYGKKKNCAKEPDKHIQYRGIWQELVLNESPDLVDWLKKLFD